MSKKGLKRLLRKPSMIQRSLLRSNSLRTGSLPFSKVMHVDPMETVHIFSMCLPLIFLLCHMFSLMLISFRIICLLNPFSETGAVHFGHNHNDRSRFSRKARYAHFSVLDCTKRGHKPNKRTCKGFLAYQHFALKIVLLFQCSHHVCSFTLGYGCWEPFDEQKHGTWDDLPQTRTYEDPADPTDQWVGPRYHACMYWACVSYSYSILVYSCERHGQIWKGGWSGPESFKGPGVSLNYNSALWKRSGGFLDLWVKDTWCWMDGWSVLLVAIILFSPWFLLFFTCNAHRTPLQESCMYTRMYT